MPSLAFEEPADPEGFFPHLIESGPPRRDRRCHTGDGMGVLKVAPHEMSEQRELRFEVDYQLSLTTAQRFEMMLRKSREMAEELLRRGHRGPASVTKRS